MDTHLADSAAFNTQAEAQALVGAESPQRPNRTSAADNDCTEGQVMLTGAKLQELIGPPAC